MPWACNVCIPCTMFDMIFHASWNSKGGACMRIRRSIPLRKSHEHFDITNASLPSRNLAPAMLHTSSDAKSLWNIPAARSVGKPEACTWLWTSSPRWPLQLIPSFFEDFSLASLSNLPSHLQTLPVVLKYLLIPRVAWCFFPSGFGRPYTVYS